MKRLLTLLFCALLLSSCVSMKSYRQTKSRMLSLEMQRQELISKIDALEARNATLEVEWVRLEVKYKAQSEELKQLQQKNEELQKGTAQTKR